MSKETVAMVVVYLGVVKEKFISGIVETDKGERFVANANTEVGDVLVKVDNYKLLVKPKEYEEKYRKFCEKDKPKYKTGVTKALRAEADDLGVEFDFDITKDELLARIDKAKELVVLGGTDNA